jgi:hypothetical protein
LRVGLVEVSKEGSVSQVLEARGIISHVILVAWDEVTSVAVAVHALVGALVVAQPSRGTISSHSSSGHS